MIKLLIVGLGGFIGAIARHSLCGLVHRLAGTSFPVGTLVVNALGCLVIGGLMCLVEERQLLSSNARTFLMIGLLGSFTTFSTLGYETFEYLRAGDLRMAGANVGANVLVGIAAVMLGWAGMRAVAA